MIIIGITGGTGAGKSTLLHVLKNMDACIIDCDKVYYELLEKSKTMNDDLKAEFPEAYSAGTLNRKKLGLLVYKNESAMRRLKEITHPRVADEVKHIIEQEKRNKKSIAAIDAFGLKESGISSICDVTIAVTAPAEDRINRIMIRDNISREYAKERILSQKSDDEYEKECDYVLLNDCKTLEEFEEKCKKFIKNILEVL